MTQYRETMPYRFRRMVNSIEECITYDNTHRIYMSEGDWYLVSVDGLIGAQEGENGTSIYHKSCTPKGGPPFVHYRELVCQGCSATPPEGIVGAFVLHNWDQMSEVNHAD